MTGFLLVLLGLWAMFVPFVGPYFDYQIGTTGTWDWSVDRLWLSVLPGMAAALGGLIMLYSTRRSTASLGGLLALAGGLWLVAGPAVSMLWNDGISASGAAIGDNGTRVSEWIGFFYGTGALITLFSAYGLGFLAALPVVGEAVRTPEPAAAPARAAPEAAPTARAARAPVPTAEHQQEQRPAARPPIRRRGLLRRRGAGRDDGTPVERR